MSIFVAFFVAGLVLAFYGVFFAIGLACAIQLWLMLLDDLKTRRSSSVRRNRP
jgi:hypothetical protein